MTICSKVTVYDEFVIDSPIKVSDSSIKVSDSTSSVIDIAT